MKEHAQMSNAQVFNEVRRGLLVLGGNKQLKIYGLLSCRSGKRMKRANRIFFASKEEAIALGFRPCGHCLREEYQMWKDGVV